MSAVLIFFGKNFGYCTAQTVDDVMIFRGEDEPRGFGGINNRLLINGSDCQHFDNFDVEAVGGEYCLGVNGTANGGTRPESVVAFVN